MRLCLCVLLAFALSAQRAVAQAFTITNATVVDVSTGSLRANASVVVDGNRIATVGSSTSTPTRGQVIDGKGMYVIPGLWDMHTHAYFGWPREFGDSYVLPLFVVNGVTGIRDMGSDLDAILRARRDVAAHRIVGPRMIVSGPMLDGPQVAFAASIAIKTPEDGRKVVDSLKRRGVDFIKIQSGVPRDAYMAIAAEAQKLGISFDGHVPDAIRASEAITAGQRTFEHLIGIYEASTPNEAEFLKRKYGAGSDTAANKSLAAFLNQYDAAHEASIVQILSSKNIWQCPTLFWERGQWLVDVIDFTKDPEIAYTPRSWVSKKFPETRTGILQSLGTDPLPVRQRWVEHELEIVRRLHAAQVPFLAGTDTPAGVGVTAGISLHHELQRFVDAGFTPLEALQTATINAARFLGKTADYGSVEKGRIADLVILRANPLTNIANTRAIAGVVADGKYLSVAELDRMRARIRQYASTH